jgi:hypothetical protein
VLPRSLPARAAPYLERACPFPGREISYIDRVRVLLGRRGRGGVDAVPNANPMARATRAATGIPARKGVIRLFADRWLVVIGHSRWLLLGGEGVARIEDRVHAGGYAEAPTRSGPSVG